MNPNDSVSSDELMHYGIKGQKWGRRRYQNADGSLTAEGRKRYGTKENFDTQYPKDVSKRVDSIKGGAGNVKKAANKATEVINAKDKSANKAKIRSDISKMSDAELRAIVNRLNMEERYAQVMESRYAPSGKSKVEKILSYAGTAAAVTVSAIELYQKIKEMKK